jgi:allantoate deiminase
VLGVLVALACVEKLRASGRRLPFAVEVVAFADEEGTRFHTSYLGSRAVAGTLAKAEMGCADATGVSLAEAIRKFGGHSAALASARRDPKQLLGYAEVHIEQGPVLFERGLPVGVVTGIAGQSRIEITFLGRAGHAGATPMTRRKDALMGAAEFMAGLERVCRNHTGLVATVGQADVRPGASNVIPGRVRLTLDVRHAEDARHRRACAAFRLAARRVAARRGLRLEWQEVQSTKSIACSAWLTELMTDAVGAAGIKTICRLPSGAGHDAAVMAGLTPVAMLFVRCREGLSHHPDESVTPGDARAAITVLGRFLESLARRKD